MRQFFALVLSGLVLLSCGSDGSRSGFELGPNPVITSIYTADPSARVFGDTLYVYPSHDRDDAKGFDMIDYHVFSTTDMVNFTDHGVIFNPIEQTLWAKEAAWAPDCIERNGKYYLYYPTDRRHIGVAVSNSPTGPFEDPL
jgi:beta-xylosidase